MKQKDTPRNNNGKAPPGLEEEGDRVCHEKVICTVT